MAWRALAPVSQCAPTARTTSGRDLIGSPGTNPTRVQPLPSARTDSWADSVVTAEAGGRLPLSWQESHRANRELSKFYTERLQAVRYYLLRAPACAVG
jgi:hypothetical protein